MNFELTNEVQRVAFVGLGAVMLLTTCFRGDYLEGLPCETDADCGPLKCVDGNCGDSSCNGNEDCPGMLECLQGSCLALRLPRLDIEEPAENTYYDHGTGDHDEVAIVVFENLKVLQSTAAVPGEGYVVAFVDETNKRTISFVDPGWTGFAMALTIPDVPGGHYIRVQAMLNDGTIYDNEGAVAKRLVWVDDGKPHVALRQPWPRDRLTTNEVDVEAEVVGFNGIELGPVWTGKPHVHVFYNKGFPACFTTHGCMDDPVGELPAQESEIGLLHLDAGVGEGRLTVVVMNADHTTYLDANGDPVYSEISIERQ